MSLSEKTKESLSRVIGIPYETLTKMDCETIDSYISQKFEHKLGWPEGVRIDGLPIKTMDEVDKEINKICKIKTYKNKR